MPAPTEPEYDFGPAQTLRLPPCELYDMPIGQESEDGVVFLYKSDGARLFAVGVAQDFAYFGLEGRLMRVPLAGGVAEDLGAFDYDLIPRDENLVIQGDRLFWVRALDGFDPTDVMSAPLSDPEAAEPLIEGLSQIRHLYADAQYLYWFDYSVDPTVVQRMPHGGGALEVVVSDHNVWGMMPYQDYLYFFDGGVWRVPLSEANESAGGSAEYLTDGHFEALFAAEGETIYWTDHNNHSVNAYTLGAQRAKQLASIVDGNAGQPRVHDGQVYFTISANCRRLVTSHRDDNEELEYEFVAQGFADAEVFSVTDSFVYLIGDGGVYRATR